MKKLFISLILTFTLLILSNIESNGQCETGYTSKTVTIQAGNCEYYVEVCYKCEVHFPGTVRINKFWLVDSTCNNALDIDLVVNTFYITMRDGAFIYSNFCPDGLYNTPPCGGGYNQFEIHYAYCWQQWYRHNGDGPVREYWPCEDNANCTETFKVCRELPSNKFITYDRIFTPPQDPPCDLQWYQVTWPSVLGEKSDCFILNHVPCGVE